MKNSIHITAFIDNLKSGGTFMPSKGILQRITVADLGGDIAAKQAALTELHLAEQRGAEAAKREARRLEGERNGRSKWTPHQGKRECARRIKKSPGWL